MTDHHDILDRLREVIEAPRDTHPWVDETGMRALAVHAIAAIEQRDQTIANLLDEKRRAMGAVADPTQPERWETDSVVYTIVGASKRVWPHEPYAVTAYDGESVRLRFRRRVTP